MNDSMFGLFSIIQLVYGIDVSFTLMMLNLPEYRYINLIHVIGIGFLFCNLFYIFATLHILDKQYKEVRTRTKGRTGDKK